MLGDAVLAALVCLCPSRAARVYFQQIFPLRDGSGLAEEAGPCSKGSGWITPSRAVFS